MEYERALFRVYERLMDSVAESSNPGSVSKSCRAFECLILVMGAVSFACLVFLHVSFVGDVGCLPHLLSEYSIIHHNSTYLNFSNDQILQIYIDGDDFPYSRRLDVLATLNNSHNESNSSITVLGGEDKPDFEFAKTWNVLRLDSSIRRAHDFELINISVPARECFGQSLQQLLLPLGGVSTVIANNVRHSVDSAGVLRITHGEYFSWPSPSLQSESVTSRLLQKCTILIAGSFSFFILSTTTAILVRVLISSGVVLLFPVFSCLQLCGIHVLNTRLIALSYPWLGIPMEIMRQRNQSAVPFLISHLSRVLLYYFMYEASQMAATMWFYDRVVPGQKEIWLFAIVMILEYYSMIYLRAASSILLFPRAAFLLFLLYHVYLYSFPLGFHLLALLVLFLLTSWLMVFTIRKLEYPAYMSGEVNLEQPRVLFNRLPWPAWSVALAPDHTIFMPVNQRSRSVYDDSVGEDGDQHSPVNPLLPLLAHLAQGGVVQQLRRSDLSDDREEASEGASEEETGSAIGSPSGSRSENQHVFRYLQEVAMRRRREVSSDAGYSRLPDDSRRDREDYTQDVEMG